MSSLFIGNTDRAWFDFLSLQDDLEAVNFWQPGGRHVFGALEPGELFLFRLKSPVNRIAGGGWFERADRIPVSVAWQIFERAAVRAAGVGADRGEGDQPPGGRGDEGVSGLIDGSVAKRAFGRAPDTNVADSAPATWTPHPQPSTVVPWASRSPAMVQLIEDKRDQLIDLCRAFRVARLDVFGSAAQGTFRPESSDLDFIARFEGTRDPDYAERFYRFAEALEVLFGRPVDVLTERMIRNPYFRATVEETRQSVVELGNEPRSAPALA